MAELKLEEYVDDFQEKALKAVAMRELRLRDELNQKYPTEKETT